MGCDARPQGRAGRTCRFDPDLAIALETRSRQTVHVRKEVDARSGEARLYCYSEARAKKECGMAERFATRFEDKLRKLDEGLRRPRTRKTLDHIWRRIGRIREKNRGAEQQKTPEIRGVLGVYENMRSTGMVEPGGVEPPTS